VDYPAQLFRILADGMLSLMLSIGFRTGLFETMARLPASTPTEVASEAGLAERYVQEWLAAMALARVTFSCPARRTTPVRLTKE